jgi:hypothetical protein
MATGILVIPQGKWTLLSEANCSFQVRGDEAILVTEQLALPTGGTEIPSKVALPKTIYVFTVQDGKLYGYSAHGDAEIALN